MIRGHGRKGDANLCGIMRNDYNILLRLRAYQHGTYGMQYQLSSPKHNGLMKLFHQICEDSGIMHDNSKIFEYLYSFEEKNSPIQLNLFD